MVPSATQSGLLTSKDLPAAHPSSPHATAHWPVLCPLKTLAPFHPTGFAYAVPLTHNALPANSLSVYHSEQS